MAHFDEHLQTFYDSMQGVLGVQRQDDRYTILHIQLHKVFYFYLIHQVLRSELFNINDQPLHEVVDLIILRMLVLEEVELAVTDE